MKKSLSTSKMTRVAFSADLLKEKERGEEKIYVDRIEKRQRKRIRIAKEAELKHDNEFYYLSEDVDVEDVLQDQQILSKLLIEAGVVDNQVLLKNLLKWKYNQL